MGALYAKHWLGIQKTFIMLLSLALVASTVAPAAAHPVDSAAPHLLVSIAYGTSTGEATRSALEPLIEECKARGGELVAITRAAPIQWVEHGAWLTFYGICEKG